MGLVGQVKGEREDSVRLSVANTCPSAICLWLTDTVVVCCFVCLLEVHGHLIVPFSLRERRWKVVVVNEGSITEIELSTYGFSLLEYRDNSHS